MQPIGSDRLRQDGDRWILSTRFEKAGWKARVEKTSTSAEFPGTAVLLGDQYFEVVRADPLPNGVRYTLEPWRDEHAIRTADRYDAESEAARLQERQATIATVRTRHAINILGILAGHLPADVQEKIGMEYGIHAHWLTFMSCAGMYAVAIAVWMTVGDKLMEGQTPEVLVIVGVFLFAETIVRTLWTFATRAPMGSFAGLLVYTIYAASRGKLIVSKPAPKGEEPPEHVLQQDALAVREPLVTLLPLPDQERVAKRFGYDYRRLSAKVAVTILVFAVLGAYTAAAQGHIPGALFAFAVVVEQVYRLSEFRIRPTGSVFGYLVRPVVRKLL